MSEPEKAIISFHITDGIITEVIEHRPVGLRPAVLLDRRDIEDAVARVVNTPVSGTEDEASPCRATPDNRPPLSVSVRHRPPPFGSQ